jgi:hypothetical protein
VPWRRAEHISDWSVHDETPSARNLRGGVLGLPHRPQGRGLMPGNDRMSSYPLLISFTTPSLGVHQSEEARAEQHQRCRFWHVADNW